MHGCSHTWSGSRSDSRIRVAADQSPIFTQAYESLACVHVCARVYVRVHSGESQFKWVKVRLASY